MCDGHALSMEAVAGDGIVPLPLCVQYDSLTGITPPVSIIFTEPCPNDCVIYRNPSATENTTGITYKDCAGVWHEDVMLLPGEEICARRSYVIGPTTGVQGPGSGTLVEVGPCGSFPDDSEPGGSGSEPAPSEPPVETCCDPTVIDATTETTIPDGSLPGGDSESEEEVCCTPVVLSATIETLDESGSASGSDSNPIIPGLRMMFDDIANADTLVGDASNVADWNTFFSTGTEATTPFTSVIVTGNEVNLIGATDLNILDDLFLSNTALLSILDETDQVVSIGSNSFNACINLATVSFPIVTIIGDGGFRFCSPALISINLPLLQTMGIEVFQDCQFLEVINLPSLTACGFEAFAGCTALTTMDLSSCSNLGGSTLNEDCFLSISGQTITLTILTATATDGDVVELQSNNTVTLILV